MSGLEIIKQNWWIVVSLFLGILGAIGGIIYVWHIIEQYILEIIIGVFVISLLAFMVIRYWPKFCSYSSKIISFIKSKIPKRGNEMTKEELKQIVNELRGINEKLGDILKLKKDFEVLKGTVLNETEGVRKDIKEEIEKVKFKAEIKRLTAEEKETLLISCVPKFKGYYPPSVEFNFEMDNRFEQSFILDRLFYKASARANKLGGSKIETCEDVYFDKRVVIQGGNKTKVSKISVVSPRICDKIKEKISKEGKYDIKWEITIEMFFEGDDGLKLLTAVIESINPYSEWETWYKMMKDEENKYWEKWYKGMK